MTFLKPFPYQGECIDTFQSWFSSGHDTGAAVLFTGAGKTVIFAHMAYRFIENTGMRVAVFVDTDELVKQTVRQIHAVNSSLRIGIVKAKRNEIWNVDVVVISIQTLANRNRKRLEQIPADHFGLLIVDECHKSGARSYRDALEYFGAFDPERDVKLAGFTATLKRADGGLGDIYEDVVYTKDMLWGIRNKFLVDVRPRSVEQEGLFDGVPTSGGDWTDAGLGSAMIEADIGSIYATALVDEAPNRQALICAPDVASAFHIAGALQAHGRTAGVIVGTTPPDERELILKRVRVGEIQDLVHVDVLTAGFDCPQISCVVPRPTSNDVVFVQQVGRGVRKNRTPPDPSSPYPWMREPKKDCLVLLINATSKLKLCTLVDLSSTPIKEVRENETLAQAVEREELEAQGQTATRAKIRITDADLFTYSPFSFRQTSGKKYLYIPTKDWLVTIYPHTTAPDTDYRVGTVWCGKGSVRKGREIVSHVDLGYAMAIAESEAEELDPVGTVARKDASWKKKKKEPATERQIGFARKLRIEIPPEPTKVELSDLIDTVVGTSILDGYTPTNKRK